LEKSRILHDFVMWMAAAGVLGWATLRWSENRFSAGDVVLVGALTFRILHGSRDLALALIGSSSQLAVIRETLQLLDSPEKEQTKPSPRSGTRPPKIEARHLCFSYGDDHPVLKPVTLEIPPGQKVGIIGRRAPENQPCSRSFTACTISSPENSCWMVIRYMNGRTKRFAKQLPSFLRTSVCFTARSLKTSAMDALTQPTVRSKLR
jgi:hypothetical protein